MYFLTWWRICEVMTNFVTYLWSHDAIFDVMTYFWRTFDVIMWLWCLAAGSTMLPFRCDCYLWLRLEFDEDGRLYTWKRDYWFPHSQFPILMSWRTYWRHDVALTSWWTFWRHVVFFMSRQTSWCHDVFRRNDELYEVMTNFLMSWLTFWCHDVFLTSLCNFNIMKIFWRHDVFLTSWKISKFRVFIFQDKK